MVKFLKIVMLDLEAKNKRTEFKIDRGKWVLFMRKMKLQAFT